MPPDMAESLRNAINAQPDEQRMLLAKLVSLTEMAEQYRASLCMVERERLQVQTQLRLAGYRPPTHRDADG